MTPQPDCLTGASRVWRLGAVLSGLLALWAGPVAAQQDAGVPSTGTLPTIIYPSHTAKPATPDIRLPVAAPEPDDCTVDDTCEVRYVIVGGFWGFWDHSRHFHRLSVAHFRAMRSRAVTWRAMAFNHAGGFGGWRAQR